MTTRVIHLHRLNVADGGSITACGEYSPARMPVRERACMFCEAMPQQTRRPALVTCGRCQRSEVFRVLRARRKRGLRIRPYQWQEAAE